MSFSNSSLKVWDFVQACLEAAMLLSISSLAATLEFGASLGNRMQASCALIALRYQKRAINQLIKAVYHVAKGEEF